eukprot:378602_1
MVKQRLANIGKKKPIYTRNHRAHGGGMDVGPPHGANGANHRMDVGPPHHYHNKNSTPTSYSFGANGGNHRMDVGPPHHYHNKNNTPTSYSFGANGGNHRMDVDPPHAHHSNTHQNKKLFQYRGTDSHNSSGENERTRSSDYCTDITHEQKTNHRDYTNDIGRKEWAEFLQYKRHRARAMAGQGHASGLSFERRRQMPLLQCQVPAFDERDGCDLSSSGNDDAIGEIDTYETSSEEEGQIAIASHRPKLKREKKRKRSRRDGTRHYGSNKKRR